MRASRGTVQRAASAAVAIMAASGLGLSAMAGGAGAAAPGPRICAGTPKVPGVLAAGTYRGAVVRGLCAVNAGHVHVIGTLLVTRGSAMIAAFGRNDKTHHGGSALTVTGDVIVGRGGTLVLGCKANPGGTGFPCVDDPSKNRPTLTSVGRVSGNIVETAPLGVIVHNSVIGGGVTETGGGGGLSCTPPKAGAFAKFNSPVYSDYEDSSLGGDLRITGLKSCWLGVARVKVQGSASFTNDGLADPDAIEIIANHIQKNLACSGNSSVWDSTETSMTGNFPRAAEPNMVNGTRSGQCVLATPTTKGGSSGPGAF